MFIVPSSEDQEYKIYKYDYLNFFVDQIYYGKMCGTTTQSLKTECQHIREKQNLVNYKLAGDIKDEFIIWDNVENVCNIKEELFKQIMQELGTHIERIVDSGDLKFELRDLWVNYQKPNEYNPTHNHGGIFSFVWYLDIPEEIKTENVNQKSNRPTRGLIEFSSEKTNERITFNPSTSDMFIFRSDHVHSVYPFYSNVERISVSGNIVNLEVNGRRH